MNQIQLAHKIRDTLNQIYHNIENNEDITEWELENILEKLKDIQEDTEQ